MKICDPTITNNTMNPQEFGKHQYLVCLYPPNVLSIYWIIIGIKILLVENVGERDIWDLVIYLTSICYSFLLFVNRRKLDATGKKIIKGFTILLIISIVGIIRNPTITAITSVAGLFCVMTFIISGAYYCNNLQAFYIKPVFYLVVVRMLLRVAAGEKLGNTAPGVLCFLSFGFAICVMDSWRKAGKGKKNILFKMIDSIALLLAFYIMLRIGWDSEARTALFTGVGIVLAFCCFQIFKKWKYKGLFWLTILSTAIIIILYMNIHSFQWYADINRYSVSSFGKNIDSSRPGLWAFSIKSLEGLEIIFGKGTGTLPMFSGYESSSFHNAYIQLLMQNGLISLITFVYVLKSLWERISAKADDTVCRLTLACFVGIIVYNAFECTLLQNKVFLGLCEWILICMGVIRSRALSKEDETIVYSLLHVK